MAEIETSSRLFTEAVGLQSTEARFFDVAFVGRTQPCPWPKAYGGDLVAQAAVAAIRSVSDGKTLHSMHSYFLRPAEIGAEIRYEVELLRDGRGYSSRQVRGYQNEKVVYVCLAGFAAGEQGATVSLDHRLEITVPEELPSSAQYLEDRFGGTMTSRSKEYWSFGRSFDMRHVPGPVYLSVDGGRSPHQAVWVKPFDALRAVAGLSDSERDAVALAYVCDYTILEPVLRALGFAWADPALSTASLDHAMWLHRAARVDDWLLYAQEALAAESGRGTALGRFYTRDGHHVATVVQEGLIRQR
ncbi:acyl-CoA thioesterase domain-containing protein [Nocardia sp. NPDC047038]|uniref:acyl-CoA thioesterase n=1 Tax=Nocardia sp. NPDC047038 TaxID=3154338 RepID=UPI0033F80309